MKRTIIIIAALAVTASVSARDIGAEFNLAWPFVPGVGIYAAKVTVPVWEAGDLHGEITTGILFRPEVFRETEGYFGEVGMNLGYRQYFFRNAHAELALWPGFGTNRENAVDGETYRSLALTTEAYAGYRFDFPVGGVTLYLLPQVGAGSTVYETNPWPKIDDGSGSVFFVANLLVGVRL